MFEFFKRKLRPKENPVEVLRALDVETEKLNGAAVKLNLAVRKIKKQRASIVTLLDDTIKAINEDKV